MHREISHLISVVTAGQPRQAARSPAHDGQRQGGQVAGKEGGRELFVAYY